MNNEVNSKPNLIISKIVARGTHLTRINVPESQFKMFAKKDPEITPIEQKDQLDGYQRRTFALGNATLFSFYKSGDTKLFISNTDADRLCDNSGDVDISEFEV